MNNKYVFIISIIVVIIALFLIFFNNKKNNKVVLKDTTSFRLFYTQGYMMNADTIYEYKKENDKYIMSIKPYLVDSENTVSFEVNNNIIKEIEDILNKYEVYKWDGFDKNDKDVLDGDSFSFSVSMNDKSISAHGYMKWPDNYRNVKSEVSSIFERELNSHK